MLTENQLLMIIAILLLIQAGLQAGLISLKAIIKKDGFDSGLLSRTAIRSDIERFGTGPEILAGKYNFESVKGPGDVITSDRQLNNVIEGLNLLDKEEYSSKYASVTHDPESYLSY
jgi:hypothetical protein